MKKTIIVSAFPGTGKTYCWVNTDLDVIDSDSSTFAKSDFPNNYIKHIKSKIGTKDIILVSSHSIVREALVKHEIPFILVYPSGECKEEYLERYRQRKSPQSFIDSMDANWDHWITSCSQQTHCEHIILLPNQYLSNVIPKDFVDKMYNTPTDVEEIDKIVIPNKDDKAKYRRELKTTLKDILINDFDITKESIRAATNGYIHDIVSKTQRLHIEQITKEKIDSFMRQIVFEEMVNNGLSVVSREMRAGISDIGHEVRKKMKEAFNMDHEKVDDLTVHDWKKISHYLYQLLDDIDTVDDIAKDNEKLYRNLVRKKQALKNVVGRSPDGYTLQFNKLPDGFEKDKINDDSVMMMNMTSSQTTPEESPQLSNSDTNCIHGSSTSNLNQEDIAFLNRQKESMCKIGSADVAGRILPLTPISIMPHFGFVELQMKESIVDNENIRYHNTPPCSMYILSDKLKGKLLELSRKEERAGGEYIHPTINSHSKNR